MNLSSALECSSRPPVSVWGTGRTARFSWGMLNRIIALAGAAAYYRGVAAPFNVPFRRYAPMPHPRRFYRGAGTGILTCCPSTAPFGLVLGPD